MDLVQTEYSTSLENWVTLFLLSVNTFSHFQFIFLLFERTADSFSCRKGPKQGSQSFLNLVSWLWRSYANQWSRSWSKLIFSLKKTITSYLLHIFSNIFYIYTFYPKMIHRLNSDLPIEPLTLIPWTRL